MSPRKHRPVVYAKKQTPTYLPPEWRLSFSLPENLRSAVPIGCYAPVLGVRVGVKGTVEIVGKSRRWLEQQCERFIRQVARYGFARPVPAVNPGH